MGTGMTWCTRFKGIQVVWKGIKVTSVCYSPDGKTALSGSNDKTVIMWDLESGVKLKVCMYWLLLT